MGLIVAEAQPPVICVARAEYRQLRKQPWLPSRVYIIPTNSAQSPSRMLKRLDRRLATEYITYICIAGCLLETMSETRTPGFCALCKSRCGSILSRGTAVLSVRSSRTRTQPANRSAFPKGAKDPGWQRISWNEAFEQTASELKRRHRFEIRNFGKLQLAGRTFGFDLWR